MGYISDTVHSLGETFVWSSISQPKHLHLLTPITAQFAARARRAVRWRPPEPRSLVSSCSGVGRGAEAGCGVEVTVSSEDTEHLLVTLDTDSQHQSLSGRPGTGTHCCGDTSQIPHCENLSDETFWLKGSPYLTCYKSCVPVTKAGPLCLPSGLCRGQLVAGDTRELGSSSTGDRTIVLWQVSNFTFGHRHHAQSVSSI